MTGKIEDLSRARLMLENKIKSAPHAERLAPRIIVGFPFRTSRQSDCLFARSVRGSMGPGRLIGAEIVLSPFRLLVFSRQPLSVVFRFTPGVTSLPQLPATHIIGHTGAKMKFDFQCLIFSPTTLFAPSAFRAQKRV